MLEQCSNSLTIKKIFHQNTDLPYNHPHSVVTQLWKLKCWLDKKIQTTLFNMCRVCPEGGARREVILLKTFYPVFSGLLRLYSPNFQSAPQVPKLFIVSCQDSLFNLFHVTAAFCSKPQQHKYKTFTLVKTQKGKNTVNNKQCKQYWYILSVIMIVNGLGWDEK